MYTSTSKTEVRPPDEMMASYAQYGEIAHQMVAAASWRTRAYEAYTAHRAAVLANLKADMAFRIKNLTGYRPSLNDIHVNEEKCTATLLFDGTIFRLQGEELTVQRPCSYCNTGLITSCAITSMVELGYAIVEWQPMHDDCRIFENDLGLQG
jgi:hypothetical protein